MKDDKEINIFKEKNSSKKKKIIIGINSILAILILAFAIVLSTSNLFNGNKIIKGALAGTDTTQRDELSGNLTVNVKNDKDEPVEGTYFDIYKKENVMEIPNFELVAEGEYYFVEQNGKIIPNNLNVNSYSSTANSYVKIDLSNMGDMVLKVNAEISGSESSYGFASITESTTIPNYYEENDRFMYIENDVSARNYTTYLTGGKVYYLHLGYKKYGNYSGATFFINDISLVKGRKESIIENMQSNGEYYFEEQNGKYVSNNKGINNSNADSYIKIDLTNSSGTNVIISSEIYSESNRDYGYIIATDSPDIPSYSSLDVDLITSSISTKDNMGIYLEGGKVHYLHFRYSKNNSVNLGNDNFIINSVYLIKTEKYSVQTSAEGYADITLPFDEYRIEEAGAPYIYNSVENSVNDVTINTENVKMNFVMDRRDANISINYYISSQFLDITHTQQGVPLKDGGYINYDNLTVKMGDNYKITPSGDIDENYTIVDIGGQVEGIVDSETIYIRFTYEPKTYTFDFSKIDESNNQKIANTVFEFSYQQIPLAPSSLIQAKGINAPERNTITVSDRFTTSNTENTEIQLYAGREYTLEEILPTNGYVRNEGKLKFIINVENGQYVVDLKEGDINNFSVEDNTVHLTIPNKPSFKLVKQSKTGEVLKGAKFTITTEDGQEVTNGLGELVGEIENINGQDLRVVTTNENGEIIEALPAGTYKITEVQAPDGYRLPEENEQIVEIEAGQVKELYSVSELDKKNLNIEYLLKGIDPSCFEFLNLNNLPEENSDKSMPATSIEVSEILPNGEIFLTGGLINDTTISGESTVLGDNIELTKSGTEMDGIFIKTDESGKIDIVTHITTNESGNSEIIKALKTKDGYEIIGMYAGEINIPAENTTTGETITLTTENEMGLFITKINNEGKIEWIKDYTFLIQDNEESILTLLYGIAQYSDDLLFIETVCPYGMYIPAEETSNGQDLYLTGESCYKIGINSEGKIASVEDNTTSISEVFRTIENIDSIQGNDFSQYYMMFTENDSLLIIAHADNLHIPGEFMTSGVDFDAYNDYIALSINNTGKIELAYSDYYPIFKALEVKDGYVLVGGYRYRMQIPAEETTNGEDIIFESDSEDNYDIYIMKMNKSGKVMWAADTDVLSENIDIRVEGSNYYIIDYDNYTIHQFNESKEVKNIVKEQKAVTFVNEPKEANITSQKTLTTENGLDYVVQDDKIKYTITVTNSGDLAKDVVITDTIPTGTTFGDESIKINDSSEYNLNNETIDLSSKTAEDLKNGITVNLAEGQTITLSFEVQVHYMDVNTTISNTAYVDGMGTNRADISYVNPEAQLGCNIAKEGTDLITSKDQQVDYKITYTAKITDYIGNAEVVITDTLPYEIDETKSDIAGGTYDAQSKTITWKQSFDNINTTKNGDYNINITKEIKIVYKDIEEGNIVNKAEGTITLQDKTNTVETQFDSQVDLPSIVIVRYVDEFGNEIGTMEIIEGPEGTTYVTHFKDIDNYEFLRVDGNTEGLLTSETQEVTYVYKKAEGKVIVRYLEKDDTPDDDTDNVVLAEEETITGKVGDPYETTRKEIDGYEEASPEPENSTGTITKEDIYVTYYYQKNQIGKVTAIYVDVDTDEEISYIDENGETKTYKEEMQGKVGEEYTTQVKDIPYYIYVEEKAPDNAQGTYTPENIEVKYYYRKQTFNMGVEKKLSKVVLNGEEKNIVSNLTKIEIVADEIPNTNLTVEYVVKVTNNSEIEGTTDVIEKLPQYFTITDGTSQDWQEQQDGTLKLTVTLAPGETKEYKVALKWNNGNNNLGVLTNLVQLSNVTNPANYAETTLEDNTSKVDLIVTVKTGGENLIPIIVTIFISLTMITSGIVIIKRKVL